MDRYRTTISGECHCGNLSFEFKTNNSRDKLLVRSCQCRFCKLHGAATARDPNGLASIAARVPEMVTLYRFASNTADFILCSKCGVYIGAAVTVKGRAYATLNMNASDLGPMKITPIAHGEETNRLRVERRVKTFTPLVDYPFGHDHQDR